MSVTDGRAALSIAPLIDDRDVDVRAAALSSLVEQKVPSVVSLKRLSDLIADPDPRVRRSAGELLAMNGPAAFPILPLMLDEFFRTEDQIEREKLIENIKAIGFSFDPDLYQKLFEPRMARALKDRDAKTRHIGLLVLLRHASEPVNNRGVYESDPVRMRAALELIRPLLADPDPTMRAEAIE